MCYPSFRFCTLVVLVSRMYKGPGTDRACVHRFSRWRFSRYSDPEAFQNDLRLAFFSCHGVATHFGVPARIYKERAANLCLWHSHYTCIPRMIRFGTGCKR